MFKQVTVLLTILLMAVSGTWPALAKTAPQEITKTEEQEARNLAAQFIEQFAESKDLAPVVEHLYVRDFVKRFNHSKLANPETSLDLYFIPGLEYDRALLSQGTPEDWRDFYVAENTFMFLGLIYASKNVRDNAQDIAPTDIYPQSVIELLNQNPNLSNVIVRKGRGTPIKTIDQLHQATTTLQQAATIMRGKTPAKLDKKELLDALKDKMFEPRLVSGGDEAYFGVPKNSRIIFMKTPVLFVLVFVREIDQLKILYAIPSTD